MTLRKLPDPLADFTYELKPCLHPEHTPPTHIVLEPGLWEHRCPGCSRTLQFRVPPKPTCIVDRFEQIASELKAAGVHIRASDWLKDLD